ncbi:unnamed protein product [Cuscuta campestris]|uniref:Cyclic nucleotide-binding domain-containing protein n=1 Tax=Cuscuta campestris TaxID=132261 RepID=A0A484LT10_9ASTE|nr:unnamed protein product [Cuscuta campestris]
MVLLAVPGVLISTFFLGCAIKLAFPYNWSWETSLLFGGLLSATDPVAVVALLKELGASKKLSTIIEGESLMNDGTAIIVYQLFLRMVLGWSFTWASVISFLLQVSIGAVAIGFAFGLSSVLWLGFIFNDTVIEITLTVAVSYVAYFTAQEFANSSGVLSVMTVGMFYSVAAKTAFMGDGKKSLHYFWEMVAYIANTLIFILSGLVIADDVLRSNNFSKTHAHSWGYLILLYVFVQVSRIVVVGMLFPFLRCFGYGLDWKEAIILVWSGLRGAVALSLSLSVKRSSENASHINPETGALFMFFTGGIVFLTLIINGSTTQFILHILGMDMLSSAKRRILKYTKYEMLNKAVEAFDNLGDDEELGPADWPSIKRYLTCLNDLEDEGIHPHYSSGNDDSLRHLNTKDIRIRFLNGVQAAYWGMLNEGRITQNTANILMESVDEALDLVSHVALCDWKGLIAHVNIPNYYKFLQTSIVPQKIVTFFIAQRLESACYICAAFLRAHRIARQQLNDFIGDSEIASSVTNESMEEGEDARKFLEEVRLTFPQVLRVVKTRQTSYVVLNRLIDYVHNLEEIGLLEEKEMIHLHDVVQTDLKKLLRNPPIVKMPLGHDLISINPFLGALPSSVSESLVGCATEIMKLSGSTLYREGDKPIGIWLISNGVVKWTSQISSHNHLLHPTFTHGSTLGLYEALVGKPYICDIITDSVVFCSFVKTENLLSALRSDPTIEDVFWQESVTILANVLLPEVFGNAGMPDLRTLVARKSTLSSYVKGECFELAHHSIGFLLEGFVKRQSDDGELVSSPAALLPNPCIGQSSQRSGTEGSFLHQAHWYQVETRARVIMLDIGAFESMRSHNRLSSSFLLHPAEHMPRSLSRESRSLMSWPEHLSMIGEHYDNQEGTSQQQHISSTQGMQPFLSGGKISSTRGHVSSNDTKSCLSQSSSDSCIPSNVSQPRGYKNENAAAEVRDQSSDESGGEDEHVVTIDSPSGLLFP